MLVVTSPAKKLDWTERDQEMTWPALHDDAVALAEVARGQSVADLMKLMHISEDLAKLNHTTVSRTSPPIRKPRPPVRRRWPLPATPTRGWKPSSLDA